MSQLYQVSIIKGKTGLWVSWLCQGIFPKRETKAGETLNTSQCLNLCPQIKYGDNTTSEGVLFATYSALIGESQAGGQHRTRLRQILQWCGEAFDGVVSCCQGRMEVGGRLDGWVAMEKGRAERLALY